MLPSLAGRASTRLGGPGGYQERWEREGKRERERREQEEGERKGDNERGGNWTEEQKGKEAKKELGREKTRN